MMGIPSYKLSPCVWQEGGRFDLLLCVVNHSDTPSQKVARIYYGTSSDGLEFTLDGEPVISPGADLPDSPDSGGCEDPTLAWVGETYYVYYTGWHEHLKRGNLLLATGPDIHHLGKGGIAVESSQRVVNPKEATIARAADASWRLFSEYASEDKSKVGLARSASVTGPWDARPAF